MPWLWCSRCRRPCGDLHLLRLAVTSLLSPPRVETEIEQFPGFSSFGGNNKILANPLTFDPTSKVRDTAQAVTPTTVVRNKLPPSVTLGEVWHLPRIKLVLPSRI